MDDLDTLIQKRSALREKMIDGMRHPGSSVQIAGPDELEFSRLTWAIEAMKTSPKVVYCLQNCHGRYWPKHGQLAKHAATARQFSSAIAAGQKLLEVLRRHGAKHGDWQIVVA